MGTWRAAGLASIVALLLLPASAHAAFPGKNGKLTFVKANGNLNEIWLADADGSGDQLVHEGGGEDYSPAWTPDKRITFTTFVGCDDGCDESLRTINADGTGLVGEATTWLDSFQRCVVVERAARLRELRLVG